LYSDADEYSLPIQKFYAARELEFSSCDHRGARMKKTLLRATLTDPHLWIPLVVLALGIALLAVLA